MRRRSALPRPRRGDRRLRPATGNLVRRRPLRRAARPRLLREGRDERLPAARRGPRVRPCGRAVLGARRHDVPPRADVQRPPDLLRHGAGQPGDPRARGPAGPRAQARGRDRGRVAPAGGEGTSWPARSARAWVRSGPWRSRPRRCASSRTSPCGSSPPATAGCSIRPLGDAVAISPPLIAAPASRSRESPPPRLRGARSGPSGLRAGRRGRRQPALNPLPRRSTRATRALPRRAAEQTDQLPALWVVSPPRTWSPVAGDHPTSALRTAAALGCDRDDPDPPS